MNMFMYDDAFISAVRHAGKWSAERCDRFVPQKMPFVPVRVSYSGREQEKERTLLKKISGPAWNQILTPLASQKQSI